MKSLLFKKLWLVSEQTRGAISVKFHPNMTLIVGKNHTGKSTLVKHIYRTLGCDTLGRSDRWDPLAIAVLSFECNGTDYLAYRRANVFALKNENTGDLRVTTKYSLWTEIIADLFDFRLTLQRHQEKLAQATPPYLFLPYYIDQDGGWSKPWNSFDKLTQFADWKKSLISYVTGQRPNDYYKAKFDLTKARSEATELQHELCVVQSALARVERSLPPSSIRLDQDAFKQEISDLLRNATQLKNEQEILRTKVFEQASAKQSLIAQLSLARTALRDTEGDLRYLTETRPQTTLLCPTCGTEHENGFPVRLELIEDTETLRKVIGELETELRKTEESLTSSYGKLDKLKSRSEKIEQTLRSKKGSLRLQDVVDSQSIETVRTAFSNELDTLGKNLMVREELAKQLKEEVSRYDSPERTKEINEYYAEHIELFAAELGVRDLRDDIKKKPDASLTASGSARPRSILAYHFAILHTAKVKGDAKLFPVVVDSPNQQGQDTEHLAQMLKFIVKRVPTRQQLILAVEENPNLEFDGCTIELSKPYSLLDSSLYEDVANELQDLVDSINRSIDEQVTSFQFEPDVNDRSTEG